MKFFKVSDFIFFISLKKLFFLGQSYFVFFVSYLFKKVIGSAFPSFLTIEVASICNLSCPECLTGRGEILSKNIFLSEQVKNEILRIEYKRILMVNLYFQGEPFLYKNLQELLSFYYNNRILVYLSTNANCYTDDLISSLVSNKVFKITVSVDGFTQDVYQKYRVGGRVEKVFDFLEKLNKEKRRQNSIFPIVEVQMLSFRHNEGEEYLVKGFCKKNGFQFRLKTAQVYTKEIIKEVLPKSDRKNRYSSRLNKKKRRFCSRIWTHSVINSDGDYCLCCFDKNSEFALGNITELSLKDFWTSKKLKNLRDQVISGKGIPAICEDCYF